MKETFPCTCHISEVRCKKKECAKKQRLRGKIREILSRITLEYLLKFEKIGVPKKEAVRAIRREFLKRNKYQYDLIDECALMISWRAKENPSEEGS